MNICFEPIGCKLEIISKNTLGSYYEFSKNKKPDLLIIDENAIPNFYKSIGVCVFSSNSGIDFSLFKTLDGAVSCGMSLTDTVGFSSINENKALVSVRRKIILPDKILEICDFSSDYNRKLSTYHNLVLSLLNYIAKI